MYVRTEIQKENKKYCCQIFKRELNKEDEFLELVVGDTRSEVRQKIKEKYKI